MEKLRVLIVDDDLRVSMLLRKVFEQDAVVKECPAYTDIEALSAFESFQPHIVILDTQLGRELRGWEVCKSIRNTGSNCFIVATSSVPEESLELWELNAKGLYDMFVNKMDIVDKRQEILSKVREKLGV